VRIRHAARRQLGSKSPVTVSKLKGSDAYRLDRTQKSVAGTGGRARDYGDGTAMSLSLINHLLQSYGYYAVFVFIALESLGIPLPGETTLIAAAVLAVSGWWAATGASCASTPRR
jgi:hypothetical protein